MSKAICVFSSSSDKISPQYFSAAEELGRLIAGQGHALVYGGANVGLMGALARSVHKNNGKVIGIIPELLKDKEVAYEEADELIITKDMRDRKSIMEERSDAFIALPGGFGTLEEVLEILTLRMLKYHQKPVALINTNNFYNNLIELFDQIINENFAKPKVREHYKVTPGVSEAMTFVESFFNSKE